MYGVNDLQRMRHVMSFKMPPSVYELCPFIIEIRITHLISNIPTIYNMSKFTIDR